MMKKVAKGILLVVLLLVLATGVRAQWSQDSLENTPICACWGDEAGAGLITDGAGGAIVFISAMRYEAGDKDIYAQHITHKGYLLWEECGRPIRVIERVKKSTELWQVLRNPDGSFYAVFSDWCWRNPHTPTPDSIIVYFQRYDSLANPLWGERGIQMTPMNIATADTAYGAGNIVPDGKGGIIYDTYWYMKHREHEEIHYYLQRMNKNGQILWDSTGVLVHSSYDPDSIHHGAQLISDGQGGVIYSFAYGSFQRVDSLGHKLWGEDAVELWPTDKVNFAQMLTNTGDGGVILLGMGENEEGKWYLRVQRVDGDGHLLWGEDGIQITPLYPSYHLWWQWMPDGHEGVIVVWVWDWRDIYAQRVDSLGQLWQEGGVPIRSGVTNACLTVDLCSDDSGGAIIVWDDRRNDTTGALYRDIYAQRVDSAGRVRWRRNGIPISLRPYSQDNPDIVSDGSGGAIIAWTDLNWDTQSFDVFGQQVNAAGKLGVVDWVEPGHEGVLPTHFALLQNYPNPFNATTTIHYTLPQVIGERFKVKGGPNTPHLIPITLKVYNILGEEVVTLVDKRQRAGSYRVVWDGKDNQGKEVGSGIYFCRLKAGRFTQVRKLALIR